MSFKVNYNYSRALLKIYFIGLFERQAEKQLKCITHILFIDIARANCYISTKDAKSK